MTTIRFLCIDQRSIQHIVDKVFSESSSNEHMGKLIQDYSSQLDGGGWKVLEIEQVPPYEMENI